MKINYSILISIALLACFLKPNESSFTTELIQTITKDHTGENVIFSPTSIETCLALAYLGAEGSTAEELQIGLQLNDSNKDAVAASYGKLLEQTRIDVGAKVKIINRIYINEHYEIAPTFNELASKYFDSQAVNMNFAHATETAEKINAWIAERTDNIIKQVIMPSALTADTAALLMNVIHFKANWDNGFRMRSTRKQNFTISGNEQVLVDMMYQQSNMLYGDFDDLDAKAIELKYEKAHNIVMLILMPRRVNDLAALEEKLKDVDLTTFSQRLRKERVRLHMPKFKYEFDLSMQAALMQLGLKSMFSAGGNFNSMLTNKMPLTITQMRHKAFIEVNEKGTDAAAITALRIMPVSLIKYRNVYDFNMNHSFFFAIKDEHNVYFAGHIVKF